jgi:heterodisulfide reductase subunit C
MHSEIIRISGAEPKKCMKCGKCSASCPPSKNMDILPHKFVKLIEDGDIDALAGSASLWNCLSCFACVERCPRNVEPSRLIEAARLYVIRKHGGNHLLADDIPELIEADDEIPQQLLVAALRKYGR